MERYDQPTEPPEQWQRNHYHDPMDDEFHGYEGRTADAVRDLWDAVYDWAGVSPDRIKRNFINVLWAHECDLTEAVLSAMEGDE